MTTRAIGQDNQRVHDPATDEWVSARYPTWKKDLLREVKRRRGHSHLSHTVAAACDRMIEEELEMSLPKDAA